jgi:hypothetical protein
MTEALGELMRMPDLLKRAVRAYNNEAKSYTGSDEVAALARRVEKLRKEQRNLVEAVKHGGDITSLTVALREGEDALAAAEDLLAKTKAEVDTAAELLDEAEVLRDAQVLAKAIKKADMEAVKAALPALVSRVVVDFSQRREALRRLPAELAANRE